MGSEIERAELAINALKNRFGVATDLDLARALKVAQSTVAGWRKRGSVPDRYLTAGPGNVSYSFTTAPMLWNDEEQHALPLALVILGGSATRTSRSLQRDGPQPLPGEAATRPRNHRKARRAPALRPGQRDRWWRRRIAASRAVKRRVTGSAAGFARGFGSPGPPDAKTMT
jgi:hypothetical protein